MGQKRIKGYTLQQNADAWYNTQKKIKVVFQKVGTGDFREFLFFKKYLRNLQQLKL